MFDLTTAAQATERDFGAVIDRLDGLADADWNTSVRCRGWQVTDLAAHLAGASRGQAEGLRRAAAGVTDLARLAPPPDGDPRSLVAALKEGRDRLLSALRELPPRTLDGAVPLPMGVTSLVLIAFRPQPSNSFRSGEDQTRSPRDSEHPRR